MDAPTCAGGTVIARAIDCLTRRAEFTTTGESQFRVEVPASSTVAPYLTSRYIARVQFNNDPDHFYEWRFLDDDARIERRGGRVSGTAYDLVNDLSAPGPIRALASGSGVPNFAFSVEATATELIDAYVLPRLAEKGYTWIAR